MPAGALRERWSEAEVCAEEVAAPRKPLRGDSPRKPLRHHREAATARDGAKHNREVTARDGASTIGKQPHSAKQSTIGTSNLPNQQHWDEQPAEPQHREEHFLAQNGAKWGGVEGVRGRNLACFFKNFVSNYIVIFYIMLFRVHL